MDLGKSGWPKHCDIMGLREMFEDHSIEMLMMIGGRATISSVHIHGERGPLSVSVEMFTLYPLPP